MLTILRCGQIPIGSMYGIYTNIWGILMVNVTIYSIHGSYGIWWSWVFSSKLGSPFNRVLKFDLCCHRNHRIPKNAHDIPHIVACKNILEYVPSPNHNNHIIWKFINPHFLFVEKSVTIMMMPKLCHWYPISIYIPCESLLMELSTWSDHPQVIEDPVHFYTITVQGADPGIGCRGVLERETAASIAILED